MSFAQSTVPPTPRVGSQPRLTRRLSILVAIAFAASAVAALAHPSSTFAWDGNAFSSGAEHDLVTLTNRSRAAAGRKALRVSSTLSSIARWRSKDMIDRDYFSHSIPGYGNVFKKISASGFCYSLAGENIGWTSEGDSTATARIHQMFMASSGHRANILGKDWDTIGVGAYKAADGKKMYTVLFANKCGSSAPNLSSKPKPKPKPKPRPKQVESRPRTTPKPHAKATPKPTPEPTPALIVPGATERVEPSTDAGPTDEVAPPTPTPSPEPTAPPEVVEPAATVEDSGHGLRVMEPSAPPGLVDTIVGGVTGFFLGG
jgi:uncharacterized protein YkwD